MLNISQCVSLTGLCHSDYNLVLLYDATFHHFINLIVNHCWLYNSGGHYISSVGITHRYIWDIIHHCSSVVGIYHLNCLLNQFINVTLVLK